MTKLLGVTFGQLTVIAAVPQHRGRQAVRCRCACGGEKVVLASNLRNGSLKSCGCQRYANAPKTHGQTGTRTYRIWGAMKSRCTNPNVPHYPRYGGRGITVCRRWMESFENFLADMGPAPDGLTIERNDNDGNYEPGNCRWATRKEQRLNTSAVRLVTAFGETKAVSEWARDSRCVVPVQALRTRLKLGWPADRALTEPSVVCNPKNRAARLLQMSAVEGAEASA